MSNDIRRYDAPDWDNAEDLHVTATYGGEEFGQAVQLSIGTGYAKLTEQ